MTPNNQMSQAQSATFKALARPTAKSVNYNVPVVAIITFAATMQQLAH